MDIRSSTTPLTRRWRVSDVRRPLPTASLVSTIRLVVVAAVVVVVVFALPLVAAALPISDTAGGVMVTAGWLLCGLSAPSHFTGTS